MESRTVPASMEYLNEVMEFVGGFLPENCPEETRRLVEISVEELFTNIASYAYSCGADGQKNGTVTVECDLRTQAGPETELRIRFTDQGVPYDPFSREDPDLTLPIEERPVGGLGIYMVKKFMDSVAYSREDGSNRVTIAKRIPKAGADGGEGDAYGAFL